MYYEHTSIHVYGLVSISIFIHSAPETKLAPKLQNLKQTKLMSSAGGGAVGIEELLKAVL